MIGLFDEEVAIFLQKPPVGFFSTWTRRTSWCERKAIAFSTSTSSYPHVWGVNLTISYFRIVLNFSNLKCQLVNSRVLWEGHKIWKTISHFFHFFYSLTSNFFDFDLIISSCMGCKLDKTGPFIFQKRSYFCKFEAITCQNRIISDLDILQQNCRNF